jgi:hypothetical protein
MDNDSAVAIVRTDNPSSSSHLTPPESPHLFPPPTPPHSAKSQSSNNAIQNHNKPAAVERAFQLLGDYRACKLTPGTTQEVALTALEYQSLLQQLDEDPKLKGYIEDKIRYVSVPHLHLLSLERRCATLTRPSLR